MTDFTSTVNANEDDWQIFYDSGWTFSSAFNSCGKINSNREWAGIRVTLTATIPAGSTIDTDVANTYLRITGNGDTSCTDIYWYVTDAADAGRVTAASGVPAIDSGSTTTYPATADHANCVHTTTWPIGAVTKDIAVGPLIQYLVTTYGELATGEHIVFWAAGSTTASDGESQYVDCDSGTGKPSLKITYTESGGAATVTQEGYRWRLDDGSESTATWAAAQDTGITAPANSIRRLRVILDTSGDVNASNYQLEYKEANDANYTKLA